MDFEPCFKVHKLVSVYPKGMKLAPVRCEISEWPMVVPGFSYPFSTGRCMLFCDTKCDASDWIFSSVHL